MLAASKGVATRHETRFGGFFVARRFHQRGSLYLVWSVVAQQQATQVARASLQPDRIAATQLLVTPAPFNTLLWRRMRGDPVPPPR